MDRITLEILKLNWRIQILQTIAVKAHARAYSALQMMLSHHDKNGESAFEAAEKESHRTLLVDLESTQTQVYQAFFF